MGSASMPSSLAMSRLLAVGVLGAAVTIVAVAARGHASAGPLVAGASRVVDRTFLCSLGLSQRGYPDPGVRRRAIQLYAGSGSDGKSSSIVVLDRHGPGRQLLLKLFAGPSRDPYGTLLDGVVVDPKRCTWLRSTRIPLSRTELSRTELPGPSSPDSSQSACSVPGRVLIRVRALLGRPAIWVRTRVEGLNTPLLGLKTNVVEASVAVRTAPAHKPIALIRLTRTEPPRFYIAAHCTDA
jgi:hypothetical protein